MENELVFLEGLFKSDSEGIELQFFKDSVYETKFRIYQRILELRKCKVEKSKGTGGKDE